MDKSNESNEITINIPENINTDIDFKNKDKDKDKFCEITNKEFSEYLKSVQEKEIFIEENILLDSDEYLRYTLEKTLEKKYDIVFNKVIEDHENLCSLLVENNYIEKLKWNEKEINIDVNKNDFITKFRLFSLLNLYKIYKKYINSENNKYIIRELIIDKILIKLNHILRESNSKEMSLQNELEESQKELKNTQTELDSKNQDIQQKESKIQELTSQLEQLQKKVNSSSMWHLQWKESEEIESADKEREKQHKQAKKELKENMEEEEKKIKKEISGRQGISDELAQAIVLMS